MARRRKLNSFVHELSDIDDDYNPGASSSSEGYGSEDGKPPLKEKKEMAEEELPFSEEEADSRVTSEEEDDEDDEILQKPAKRAKTSSSGDYHDLLGFPEIYTLELASRIEHVARGRRRGAGGKRKKKSEGEENSCNKEWLKWDEEFKSYKHWGSADDEKEYEANRKKLAASMERAETPKEFVFPLLPFQAEFLTWGLRQELSKYKGGILADEMGMGKTIQALSLVLGGRAASHGHSEASVLEAEKLEVKLEDAGLTPGLLEEVKLEKIEATLVVCPVVAIEQWRSEIERFTTEGALKVLVYHGNSRRNIELEDLADYDIILSTYSTIEHDYRKMLPGKLRCMYCRKALTEKGYKKHLKFHCGPDKVKASSSKAKASSKGEASKKKNKKKGPLKRMRGVSDDALDKACEDAERVVTRGFSLLHSVKWVRVILDEAHTIKEKASNTAKAVFALESCYRWLLSGTPLQNRIGELYSLVRFLRLDPFAYFFCTKCDCKILDHQVMCDKCEHTGCHYSWWNRFVSNPVKLNGYGNIDGGQSMKLLKRNILDQVLLRRTKTERAADLVMPPKTVIVRKDALDEVEEDYYECLYKQSKTKFDVFVKEDMIGENYASIFDLLTRLRQAVDHAFLIKYSASAGNKPLFCGLCNDNCQDPVMAQCGDIFCNACLREGVEANKACQRCERLLAFGESSKPIVVTPPEARNNSLKGYSKSSIMQRVDLETFRTSTKIEALKEEIRRMISTDPSAKALVFSQFTSMLDLIRYSLNLAGIKCVNMDGSMALGQRVNMIDTFRNDPDCKIFLMSLKAGGVALNLTVASRIFVMDPWWNPAVEHQAQDRIHRIGQCKPISVTRFIIENSVEERILQLQAKKQLVFEGTIGGVSDALGKLTVKDFKFLFSS